MRKPRDLENFEEKPEKTKEKHKFEIPLTVRIDYPMDKQLEQIALFERKTGKSALVRDWITDKLHTYERNPQYLRWLKQLSDQKAGEKP